jgi:dipeptidyl aminopeptidase/acylaminoacyl peptidase
MADGTVVAAWRAAGNGHLGTVAEGQAHALELPYTSFAHLSPGGGGHGSSVVCVAGGPTTASEVVHINTDGAVEVLRRSRPRKTAEEWLSTGEAFSFGTGNGEKAHGIYYAPVNPDFSAPAGDAPPLIVTSHGGPTGSASRVLDLATQYWTTRGFAVVDVDYRGSTGYGRAYRRALDGVWGVADVEDCAAAAQWLADQGRADARRMVIRGGSASGLTVLAALARYSVFAAGAVRFPVADIGALAATTHKFESRYMERLVPPGEFEARSPLGMVADIGAPVLFLQGLDDKIVPPAQSRDMVMALRQAGTQALLVEIEGESHGFRRADTLVRALEAELAFFGAVLGVEPADDLGRAGADLEEAASPAGARWSAGD